MTDGDGHYRVHEPSRHLGRLPGITAVDCHYWHRYLWRLLDLCDVLILPFIHGWDYFPVIERRRKAGKVTVFEANDYYLDLQPWNPIAPMWLDADARAEHAEYMRAADAVQTSTQRLAEHWRPTARRVAVFPNQLSSVPPLGPPPERPLTIGWGGSAGHLADWQAIAPALQQWLERHPDVHLAVMSYELARDFIDLPAERYHFRNAGSLRDYEEFLDTLDIGLAPLLPTEYNRCRSDVKFLEYAAHGVVGLYADPGPYADTVRQGETGFLYRTEEELIRYLDLLYSEPELRRRIRQQAYDYVSKERLLSDHIQDRAEFYKSLLPRGPESPNLPEEILAAAKREENYLRLELTDLERDFVRVARSRPSQEAADALARIVAQAPDYLMAVQGLGKVLNDLRCPREAVQHLQQALQLDPQHARAMGELGRSYFLLNDVAAARRHLDEALQVNPMHVPTWVYMLRLLKLKKQPDEAAILERMRKIHPHSYMLALLAADLHEGTEAVKYVNETLKRFAAELTRDQLRVAAPHFVKAISSAVAPVMSAPETLDLLRRAVGVFPYSARLADIFGRALRQARDHVAANEQFRRALELRTAALQFRQEYQDNDDTYRRWQVAEYILDQQDRGEGPAP